MQRMVRNTRPEPHQVGETGRPAGARPGGRNGESAAPHKNKGHNAQPNPNGANCMPLHGFPPPAGQTVNRYACGNATRLMQPPRADPERRFRPSGIGAFKRARYSRFTISQLGHSVRQRRTTLAHPFRTSAGPWRSPPSSSARAVDCHIWAFLPVFSQLRKCPEAATLGLITRRSAKPTSCKALQLLFRLHSLAEQERVVPVATERQMQAF